MVLITLILAVELINRTENSPPIQTRRQVESLNKVIQQLRIEINSLENMMAERRQNVSDLPVLDEQTLESQLSQSARRVSKMETSIALARQSLKQTQRALNKAKERRKTDERSEGEKLNATEAELQEKEELLSQVSSSERVFFRSGVRDKTTWILEVSEAQFRAAKVGENAVPISLVSMMDLEKWVNHRDITREAVFIIVKPPNASDLFDKVLEVATNSGVDVGYALVGAHQQVLDPQIGAGAP